LAGDLAAGDDIVHWNSILNMLDFGEMPPIGSQFTNPFTNTSFRNSDSTLPIMIDQTSAVFVSFARFYGTLYLSYASKLSLIVMNVTHKS
jgi:hypothetical protein